MASNLSEDDFYLSDIHCEYESVLIENGNSQIRTTRLEYIFPDDTSTNEADSFVESLNYDDDGDLVVSRKSKEKNVITIEHSMQTKISHVGLQLWRASLFMCDYLLNNTSFLRDKTVVELGAGLGIASMFCSMYAKFVYCTDLVDIVRQAENNFKINKRTFNSTENILFRELDWSEYGEIFKEKVSRQNIEEIKTDEYSLSQFDLEQLKDASIFLAADVVYENSLTLKLMNILYVLMVHGNRQSKTCYIANEKRVNFNNQTYSSTDTAYSFFMECLSDLNDYEDYEKRYRFKVEQIDCNKLPFYILNYKRNDYLSIWKIVCTPL